jgi:hypothetical protein
MDPLEGGFYFLEGLRNRFTFDLKNCLRDTNNGELYENMYEL